MSLSFKELFDQAFPDDKRIAMLTKLVDAAEKGDIKVGLVLLDYLEKFKEEDASLFMEARKQHEADIIRIYGDIEQVQ